MTNPVARAIAELLKISTPTRIDSFTDWKNCFYSLRQQHTPAETALLGGARAPCAGYAFASGYQAALHSMTDSSPSDGIGALCVTEENGNHPRAIATTLTLSDNRQGWLNGNKTFVTGGPRADYLLVAAKAGETPEGLPALKLVRIGSEAEGVSIAPMPPLPFVPEIEHASVSFVDVHVSESDILAGDGYANYVKPFRTIEDIHVTLALCAYLTRVCQNIGHTGDQLTPWLSLTAQHLQLAAMPPSDPTTHLLLAGARQQLERLLPDMEAQWKSCAPENFTKWQTDKALLKVAGKAREQRTAAALKQLGLS